MNFFSADMRSWCASGARKAALWSATAPTVAAKGAFFAKFDSPDPVFYAFFGGNAGVGRSCGEKMAEIDRGFTEIGPPLFFFFFSDFSDFIIFL
jgi:hypothetical protein